MFSTAIVIFREMIEIALIVGIVLAATRGLSGRMLWIFGGVAGGIAGAGLVAVFAEVISDMAKGMGQELFNAGILFTASLVIGWTVLWMRSHAREMTAHLRQVGQQVGDGSLPFYSLSLIIGLAILREGSEIVLFVYGMVLSGQSHFEIIIGSVVGVISGTIVGVLFYYGILKISTRYMLTVTSWLLMILVAGLATQGVGYLTAAGYFDGFSKTVWNTSWLLDESSILGKALHSLLGYTAKPTQIQLVTYIGTLMTLFIATTIIEKKKHAAHAATIAIFAAITCASSPALAIDKIYDPYVTKGEAELEFAGSRTADHNKDKNDAQESEFELGYGLTDHWELELSTGVERSTGQSPIVTDEEIENRFQFWQPGEMWIDTGLLLSYQKAFHKDDSDTIEAKLLLQKDIGLISSVMNIGFEQGIGTPSVGGPDFSIQWNTRYRLTEYFQPGIELQSDFGQLNTRDSQSFKEQEHYIGPASFGKICGNLGYEAAYLKGITDGAANSAVRLMLEYEMHF